MPARERRSTTVLRKQPLYLTRHGAIKWNAKSSTKPEVYNVSQRLERKTEPRQQETRTENVMKFGCVVFELCERTDRQTDRHTHHNTSHTSRGRITTLVVIISSYLKFTAPRVLCVTKKLNKKATFKETYQSMWAKFAAHAR